MTRLGRRGLRSTFLVTMTALVCIVSCGKGNPGDAAESGASTTESIVPTQTSAPQSSSLEVSSTGSETVAPSSSSAEESSSESESSTPASSSSSEPSSADDGFDYLPWGPDDPPIPDQYAALASSPQRCGDLAAAGVSGEFWELAIAVCKAISADGPWPATTKVPSPPAARNAFQACLNGELAVMLKRSLRWHADNPVGKPKVRYRSAATRSPCQYRVYEIRVLGEADLSSGEDHPVGVALAITGNGFQNDADVKVDGVPAEFTGDFDVADPGDGLVTVVRLVPPAAEQRTVRIEVPTDVKTLVAKALLPASQASPSPSSEGGSSAPNGGEPSSSESASSESASAGVGSDS